MGDAFAARLEGNEFGVLPPANRISATMLATLVAEQVPLPSHMDVCILRVGARVSIAFDAGDVDEPAALLQQADEALHCEGI